MNHINAKRVILGGLLAGLILIIGDFILTRFVPADASQRLGLAQPGAGQMLVFAVLNLVLGMVLVWLYAAIRPRFGPGVQTAIRAGCAGWVLCVLFPTLWLALLGMFPAIMLLISLIWSLVCFPLSTLAGAWYYQEEVAATAPAT
jgi:hypothetical protein